MKLILWFTEGHDLLNNERIKLNLFLMSSGLHAIIFKISRMTGV
jgi:hypothetical protein